ncbi:hypothetical protein JCM9492_04100 [Aquifex pyrophilus]
MLARVRIRLKESEVPEEFLFNLLNKVLGIDRGDYERIRKDDGSITVYIRDPVLLGRIQEIADKYASIIEIKIEKESVGELFSRIYTAVKSNVGLLISWSIALLVLSILSTLPYLGTLFGFSLNAFLNAFILHVIDKLKYADYNDKKELEKVFKGIKFEETFTKFFKSGLGVSLGIFLVNVIFFSVLIAVLLVYANSIPNWNMVHTNKLAFVLLALVILFLIWEVYVMPLLFSRVLERGRGSFIKTLKSTLEMLTPNFVRESFSSHYVSVGILWSFLFTVGFLGIIFLSLFVVTIPLAFLIPYTLSLELAFISLEYIEKKRDIKGAS